MQYPVRAKSRENLGRVQQKQRTRQALFDAVNRILARGEVPTIDGVAAEAKVSRATAYRYYSRVDALVADAFYSERIPGPEEFFPDQEGSPVERALEVERVTHELLLQDEISLHVIQREFVETWLSNPPDRRPPRPGRRMPLIVAALEPYRKQLGPKMIRRLRNSLALVIGLEALVSLRDVCGLSVEESRETARWAVNALVEKAFDEAGVRASDAES